MRRLIVLASLVVLASCGDKPDEAPAIPEGPYEWGASATADKAEIQVGEDLSVQITVHHPPGAEFLIPSGAELEPFELIERVDETPASPVESRITLTMAAYRLPGEIAVPAIQVEYRDESGEMTSIETAPIPIRLVTSLTPDVTDINDIKGPVEDLPVPGRWGNLWWLLLALLAAIIAYLVYRKLRKDRTAPMTAVPAAPPLAPEIEAEKALRKLADARLIEQGRALEFYTALAEILKRYSGRRFSVPYLERTTTEVLTDLKQTRLKYDSMEILRGILRAADLVKFARVAQADEESQRMIPEAFRFVKETKPQPAPPVVTASDPSVEEARA